VLNTKFLRLSLYSTLCHVCDRITKYKVTFYYNVLVKKLVRNIFRLPTGMWPDSAILLHFQNKHKSNASRSALPTLQYNALIEAKAKAK